ncbi:MAG: NFACT RNA binding domain-containing protein [Candidatus Pacearchaeota archaeon]
MVFRNFELKSGTRVFLGKDSESNDELMKKFKGKNNTILHTESPGSPFGVIEKIKPTKEEIYGTGVIVAKYSQDWRDKKKDVELNVFTGKDISKPWFSKPGSWKVKKSKKIKVKKGDILKFEREKK